MTPYQPGRHEFVSGVSESRRPVILGRLIAAISAAPGPRMEISFYISATTPTLLPKSPGELL